MHTYIEQNTKNTNSKIDFWYEADDVIENFNV